jgi:hypothetical protein
MHQSEINQMNVAVKLQELLFIYFDDLNRKAPALQNIYILGAGHFLFHVQIMTLYTEKFTLFDFSLLNHLKTTHLYVHYVLFSIAILTMLLFLVSLVWRNRYVFRCLSILFLLMRYCNIPLFWGLMPFWYLYPFYILWMLFYLFILCGYFETTTSGVFNSPHSRFELLIFFFAAVLTFANYWVREPLFVGMFNLLLFLTLYTTHLTVFPYYSYDLNYFVSLALFVNIILVLSIFMSSFTLNSLPQLLMIALPGFSYLCYLIAFWRTKVLSYGLPKTVLEVEIFARSATTPDEKKKI